MGVFNSQKFAWPDEAIDLAVILWKDGKSATEIGKKIGVSRNAVIGKLVRLGVTADSRHIPTVECKPKPEKRAMRLQNIPRKVGPPPKVEKPPENGIGIMDLRIGVCRWPIGGWGFEMRYCGCEAGRIYCSKHAEIAFEPVSKKKTRDAIRGALYANGK